MEIISTTNTSNPVSFENTAIAFSSKSNKELRKAYWLFNLFNYPLIVNTGKKLMVLALKLHLPIASLVKSTVFRQFCGGETLEETMKTAQKLASYGIKTDLAYSIEGKNREEDFERTTQETVRLIQNSKNDPNIIFISIKVTGYARVSLLEKIHAKESLTESEKNEFKKVRDRTDQICKAAEECDKKIFVDAEESWLQQPIDDIATQMMQKYNKQKIVVYNTVQLYRWDRLEFLQQSYQHAQKEGYMYAVKIVRGAYMEKERLRAAKMGYPSPIHADKDSTDKDYNAAIDFCVANMDNLALCVASHNQDSCLYLTKLIEKHRLPKNHPRLYCGQLYGMSDQISFNLSNAGYNVAKYVPYGPLAEVMPYLIRRAEENTSIAGQMGRELLLLKKEIQRRQNQKA